MKIKIVSGGQTGADLGGIHFAMKHELPWGGWAPQGWINEEGKIDKRYRLNLQTGYGLKECNPRKPGDPKATQHWAYVDRTIRNIVDSDATIVFAQNEGQLESGGTKLTIDALVERGTPYMLVCLNRGHIGWKAPGAIFSWVHRNAFHTINIAGPRESKAPGIERQVEGYLDQVFFSGHQDPAIFGNWDRVGGNYGRAVADNAVLYKSIWIEAGGWLHVTALQIHEPDEECGCDRQGEQHSADGDLQEEYERLVTLSAQDNPFVSVQIEEERYVVFATPFCR